MSQDQLAQEGASLVATSRDLAVVDPESFARAGELLKSVKGYLRRVAEVFDPIIESAHLAHKTALGQRKAVEQHALTAERLLKERMGAYQEAEERRRREAEEAARRERERLEAEERARVAAEEARRRREAEERQLEEAAAAEAAGDSARAEAIITAPVIIEPVPPTPVFVAPPPAPPARVEGVSFRDEWTFEIVTPALLPREYLMPDETKIRGVVRALKGATAIPGVRAFARKTPAVRA